MSRPLPPPLTASARTARFAFYCTLCSKGYSRVHEFEAHENSYDHQHKKRFQEMKALQKPAVRTRRGSVGSAGVVTVALGAGGEGGGGEKRKKIGFRSAFGGGEKKDVGDGERGEVAGDGESDWDEEGEGEELYDPTRPTGV